MEVVPHSSHSFNMKVRICWFIFSVAQCSNVIFWKWIYKLKLSIIYMVINVYIVIAANCYKWVIFEYLKLRNIGSIYCLYMLITVFLIAVASICRPASDPLDLCFVVSRGQWFIRTSSTSSPSSSWWPRRIRWPRRLNHNEYTRTTSAIVKPLRSLIDFKVSFSFLSLEGIHINQKQINSSFESFFIETILISCIGQLLKSTTLSITLATSPVESSIGETKSIHANSKLNYKPLHFKSKTYFAIKTYVLKHFWKMCY